MQCNTASHATCHRVSGDGNQADKLVATLIDVWSQGRVTVRRFLSRLPTSRILYVVSILFLYSTVITRHFLTVRRFCASFEAICVAPSDPSWAFAADAVICARYGAKERVAPAHS